MKKIFSLSVILLATAILTAQEKEKPPIGETPKDFILPKKEVLNLENGLSLVMIPYGNIPKATITVDIKSGNIHETKDQVGLSNLMGDLLKEGSTTKDSKQIANQMAEMGGNLSISVRQHNTTVSASVLYEFAPDALKLIGDILKNPRWPETDLERLKNDMKRNLAVSLSRPQTQARKDFFGKLYPDHPYGRTHSSDEMIDAFTLDNIKNFYNSNYGAQRTIVYIAGKFNTNAVKEVVQNIFTDWQKGPEPYYPVAKATSTTLTQIIDRPDAPQSTIYYGLPVIDPSHPDFIALQVTNSLLGGSFGSRITSNIREDKGYTYSPRSSVISNYKSGVWIESADVTTKHTGASIKEIKNEIVKLQNELPTEEELQGIKNYESGIFVLRNSTPGGIINQLSFIDRHNLDESYLKDRVKNIQNITPEKVKETTKKYIDPNKMTLVIVGDKKKVQQQVTEIIEKESLKQ
ncbi:M16 family metallopeptidase [Aquimarina algicola]|uniref:Insulinase family protein n=1 Tax=Aquimarina algicola TaxID=2589995 RepID=A0A504JCZ4_9FLAO|nr:pitrilysin family protein [Aquimarina algicola]TPN88737.1 insulinase family protein [Aquimarina algicola]